jgi:hypothetical protein
MNLLVWVVLAAPQGATSIIVIFLKYWAPGVPTGGPFCAVKAMAHPS